VPKRWSKERFCIITTTTFLIVAAGTGVGVAVGVGVGAIKEFLTPPHPSIRARHRGLKKQTSILLKGTAPLRVFESDHLSRVGLVFTVF
jgi:hypothetical protein